jgi:hypothetical protein
LNILWEIREHSALNIIWEIKIPWCIAYNIGNKRTWCLNMIWEIREQ